MSAYRRPLVPHRVFVDADGVQIPYGSRWGEQAPAEDSYSVTSNLERFRPLHAIADALIEWLSQSFDVRVEDALEYAADMVHPAPDAIRAVRVVPRSSSAATLTFVSTSFPGIHLHAGLLVDFAFPSCGCDACDETWESCADDLEWTVSTIVGGGLTESLAPGRELDFGYRLVEPGARSTGGSSRSVDLPAERFSAVGEALSAGRVWEAWAPRS
jgi:hypothetical protein